MRISYNMARILFCLVPCALFNLLSAGIIAYIWLIPVIQANRSAHCSTQSNMIILNTGNQGNPVKETALNAIYRNLVGTTSECFFDIRDPINTISYYPIYINPIILIGLFVLFSLIFGICIVGVAVRTYRTKKARKDYTEI